MKIQALAAAAFLLAMSPAFAQQPTAPAAPQPAAAPVVQRDLCGARIMTSMVKANYQVECLSLGKMSIDRLHKAGYRVTATLVAPGSDRHEVEVGLFVEKADK